MDIQRQDIEEKKLKSFFDSKEYKKNNNYSKNDLLKIIKLIKESKKPIILA
jgi:thiamine pyrophosphate-dependent acetolactate synthase large subunit-like protein